MNGAALYVICNEAKAPELTPEALETMRADVQSAYDTIFAPVHNVEGVEIRVGAPETADARILHLVDAIPEEPDALAYHTVDDQGRPVLRLGVETIRSQGGALLDEISKAASHEVFETAVNPFVAFFCAVPGERRMLALEVCDPVQGGSFRHGSSAISNFVLPAYFDAEDLDGPFDHVGELVAPLSCAAAGYQAWSDGTQTFGAEVREARRAHVAKHGRVAQSLAAKAAA